MKTFHTVYPLAVEAAQARGAEGMSMPELQALGQANGAPVSIPRINQCVRDWCDAGAFFSEPRVRRYTDSNGFERGVRYLIYRPTTRVWDPLVVAQAVRSSLLAREFLAARGVAAPPELDAPVAPKPHWTDDYERRVALGREPKTTQPALWEPEPEPAPQATHLPRSLDLPLSPDRFFDARMTADGVLISYAEFFRVNQLLQLLTDKD